MGTIAICTENLSKRYLIGHQSVNGDRYTALRDVIMRNVLSFGRKTTEFLQGRQIVVGNVVEEFWALKDVSFEIEQSEIVGIVGNNGAGKSTLLKILSRITEPTCGRVKIMGRVASLLEVGTGFHPELTGRENIFLNGAILGMSRNEIRRKFDEIVDFAEVETFIDTPVKRYSSGMYVRLAFAIAAHIEPEILVIDEVLAVGDANFQRKCLGKMDDISRREGRTVLLVSHNMGAISSLCPKVIWLDKGSIRRCGDTAGILAEYLSQTMQNGQRLVDLETSARPQPADNRFTLKCFEWLCDLPLRHAEPVRARVHFRTRGSVSDIAIAVGFSALDGKRLLTYESDFQDGIRPHFTCAGVYAVDIEIGALPLAPDIYSLDIGCRSGEFHSLDYIPARVCLEVVPGRKTPGNIVQRDAGVRLESSWTWSG